MKQILQNLKTGATELTEVPCPSIRRGHLLIRTSRTLVSAGTERMLVEFGKAGWIDKARQQPDKVRMVLDKIRTDGLMPTLETVRNKLGQPLPLGYCNVGTVIGDQWSVVSGQESENSSQKSVDRLPTTVHRLPFKEGDRVASNGKHAEVVSVPMNLCAKVPDNVSDEEAAFTVVGAIALQGIRLVQPTLGEAVVVTGLGLIGLITVQLLRAHGCRVLGIDFDPAKLELAKSFGAEVVNPAVGEDPLAAAQAFSRGRGVDAVIITASTRSSEPVHQAALMCRKRGRIVLVGVTGLELSRADFYEKELSFQVSCSYGPGRYDPNYEEKGQDYPFGFVRWTEQRNFEAVLDMMADGRLNVKPLISHRFHIDDAEKAYELVGSAAPSLGILLDYSIPESDTKLSEALLNRTVILKSPQSFTADHRPPTTDYRPTVSFIGSGNYATAVLIPAFKEAGVRLRCVASSAGVSGVHAAKKYGFEETTTETERVFSDTDTNSIVITTRHDSHARFVIKALNAGKNVFVEKPLALTLDELEEISSQWSVVSGQWSVVSSQSSEVGSQESAVRRPIIDHRPPILMVGFNRRFAPQVQKMKALLAGVKGPKSFVMTVNAGAIPSNHWTQDPAVGGGRIVGEACHFIDLLRFLAGVPIKDYSRNAMDVATGDTVSLQLSFADGSIGTVHYFANGSKLFPKERLEVFVSGRVLQLDNFRKLTGYGWPGFSKMNLWRQDKGQKACAAAFVKAVEQGGPAPVPFDEIMEVSRISIELAAVLWGRGKITPMGGIYGE